LSVPLATDREQVLKMKIEKVKILEALRQRGLHTRADWVDRELPDHVDTNQHAGLLATLGLNPDDLVDKPS
jgi:hypothetical protein